ncbi:histidine kinase [Granulicoccus sp. GXG6511]|uniref:histidine kinase n=1 Tax=Granulicoccus sp. GXG6511 TaxID=3381351 RepID=UPI003D7C9F8F
MVVAIVVVAVALGCIAAAAEITVQRRTGLLLGAALGPVALSVVALGFALVGAWLVRARPRLGVGWLFLAAGSLAQAGVAGENAGRVGWLVWEGTAVGLGVDLLGGLGLYLLIGLLPVLYPTGRLGQWPERAVAALTGIGAILLQVQWLRAQLDPAYAWPLGDQPARTWVAWIPLLLAGTGVAGGWALSVVRLVRAGHPERLQRAWLLVSVVAVIVTQSLGSSPLASALQAVTLWLLPVAIAVGVVRYGLLGIDTAVPRTVTAGVLALAITVVYLISTGIGELAGVGRVGSALLASLVVAIVLGPLRDRLRAGVDRFLYGRQEVRAQLQRELHDGLGPSLTGMRLGLNALSDALAAGDTATATTITAALTEEANRSVVEVRRVSTVCGPPISSGSTLRPPCAGA